MKILIAEDDPVTRSLLAADNPPPVAILDWKMPGMDGVEVCRSVRKEPDGGLPYIIMLTSMGDRKDLIAGLEAGANDYVTKPFDHQELKARLGVGVRMVELGELLAARVRDLEEALARVKQLSGLLPICAYCKKVRDDKNYWQQVESYVGQHSEARFSHGICPDCYQKEVRPALDRMSSESSRK